MGSLDDHRHADVALAQLRKHAEPIEIRHDEIEHDAVDGGVRRGERGDGGIAAVGRDGLIAETRDHILDQPPLHRIVVGDQNTLGHCKPLFQFGAI